MNADQAEKEKNQWVIVSLVINKYSKFVNLLL